MQKIAWITDSTCYIDPEYAKQNNIFVVPIGITFENETYKDGIDIREEELYSKLSTSRTLPKTSQPVIGELVDLFEELKTEYDLAIAVHLSTELSGTANATKQAADMAGFPLELVDSRLISLPVAHLIRKGQELIREGVSPEDTATTLRAMYQSNKLYVMIGSLEQLHKGGRVSAIQMLMGSLLQIKPILTFEDGKLIPYDKVRSQRKALSYMVARLKDDLDQGVSIKTVYILEGSAKQEALSIQEQVRSLLPEIEIIIGPLGSAIGVHAGAGTIALTWFKEE
ncbi:DegV family protein [Niallia endozanthoxylica]|uniref:DegV family protein n=1 Tax=Niallia endozanthoxylica TaxID=2036016 RepID=UPI00168A5763|nr:DegV family protein [Niallia endozanthoxylica]